MTISERRWVRVSAALGALALAPLAGPAAGQRPGVPEEPPARLLFWGTGGVSLRQDPLRTHFADVWTGNARLAVPIGKFAPFVNGVYSRAKTACPTGATDCSNKDTRLLGGLAYIANGGGPGPYVGLGLGVRDYRGKQDLGHSFFIGLTIPGTRYLAPTFELRSEGYRDLNELLIMSAGFRFTIPRPAPPPRPEGS